MHSVSVSSFVRLSDYQRDVNEHVLCITVLYHTLLLKVLWMLTSKEQFSRENLFFYLVTYI